MFNRFRDSSPKTWAVIMLGRFWRNMSPFNTSANFSTEILFQKKIMPHILHLFINKKEKEKKFTIKRCQSKHSISHIDTKT